MKAPGTRVDIRQVAAEAGVSTATVSRVLSGRGPASAEARRKVLGAAGRLRYVANASASGLRTDRSMIVGVLLPNLGNPVFLPFLRAVEAAVQAHGYSVMVTDTQRSAENERHQLERLLTQRIDALIMAGRPNDPQYVGRMVEEGLPVIDPVTWAAERGQTAVASGDEAVVEACQHLASLGHRRIAFVVRAGALQATSRPRWELIEATCRSLGMEPSLVKGGAVPVPDPAPDPVPDPVTDRDRDAVGRMVRLVADLLAAPRPPTALWSNSHVLAPHVLEALARADVDLPADCSFLTFGDSPWAAAYRPPINVVAGDMAATGSLVARAMLHRLGVVADAPAGTVPPDTYRRRASVGPAPRR